MSPPRKRSTYKPRRDRREVAIAVTASVLIVVVTFTLIWVLRPNKDLGSSQTPAITTPATTTTPGATTTAPVATTPPETTTAPQP
jgi:hypothetical protein